MGVSFGSLAIVRRNYLGARCERCRILDCASMCLLLKMWSCSILVDGFIKTCCLLLELNRAGISKITMSPFSIVKDFDVIGHIGTYLFMRYSDRLCLMDKDRTVKADVIDAVPNSETLSPVLNVEVYLDLDNQQPMVLER